MKVRKSYYTQAKSLRQSLKSYDIKIKVYERQYFMKRRSENVERLYIFTTRKKTRVEHYFLAPLKLSAYVSES